MLLSVKKSGIIEGYAKFNAMSKRRLSKKASASQLLEHTGQRLLIEDMTQNVFVLEQKYRVKDERFLGILERLCLCGASTKQGQFSILVLFSGA